MHMPVDEAGCDELPVQVVGRPGTVLGGARSAVTRMHARDQLPDDADVRLAQFQRCRPRGWIAGIAVDAQADEGVAGGAARRAAGEAGCEGRAVRRGPAGEHQVEVA